MNDKIFWIWNIGKNDYLVSLLFRLRFWLPGTKLDLGVLILKKKTLCIGFEFTQSYPRCAETDVGCWREGGLPCPFGGCLYSGDWWTRTRDMFQTRFYRHGWEWSTPTESGPRWRRSSRNRLSDPHFGWPLGRFLSSPYCKTKKMNCDVWDWLISNHEVRAKYFSYIFVSKEETLSLNIPYHSKHNSHFLEWFYDYFCKKSQTKNKTYIRENPINFSIK